MHSCGCPLKLLSAGAADHVAPPPPAGLRRRRPVMKTRERDIAMRTRPAAGLGLFIGSEALRDHWPPILADMLRP